MRPAAHPAALRIQSVLGGRFNVVEFDASTKTSADAAAAVGCTVGQIAKSIVLKTVKGERPVLVIASGINRVDEKKIGTLMGEKVKSADVDFVLRMTGFAPGGVPPVGHLTPPAVFIDQSLGQFEAIWAAAGTANAVFQLTLSDLQAITGGTVADISKITA